MTVRFFTWPKITVLLVLSVNFTYAQELNEQLTFTLSNDKFADNDKYFTNGLYVDYQKGLAKSFVLPKTAYNKLQLRLGLGHEIYSPASLSSINTAEFDRPFAGWLYGLLEIASIKEKSKFSLALETGITGEESLAGSLQIGLHEFFGIDSRPTWVEELEFKWLFNLKMKHIVSWWSHDHSTFQYTLDTSIGTKDIYLENSLHYFFGRLNPFQNSSRTGIVNAIAAKEFFGYLSIGHRYVAHNTLIQGSIFSDDPLFTTTITKHILKSEIGAVLQSKQNTFKIIYNFNTQETPLSTGHIYGSLVYARSF